MTDSRVGVVVTTWGGGSFLGTTLAHIPQGVPVMVVDTKEERWPLARGWNHGIAEMLRNGRECVVVMNDDVVLREDTLDLLAWGLLDDQHSERYPTLWGADKPELLILSARHAAPSDACTNEPNWDLLAAATPAWQPGPDFAMFACGRRLIEEVGWFDEGFGAFYEDNDMHRRVQLAGFEGGALAPAWHFRNGTIRTDAERRAAVHEVFRQSQSHYARKWGAPDDGQTPLGRERFATPFGR